MDETQNSPEHEFKSLTILNFFPNKPISFLILSLVITHCIAILAPALVFDTMISLFSPSLLFTFMFLYNLFLSSLSFLPTAAIIITAASLRTNRPVSIGAFISAMPGIIKRLSITFLWLSPFPWVLRFYYVSYIAELVSHTSSFCFTISVGIIIGLFLNHITVLWSLASVVSVFEQVNGLVAIKRSWRLLGQENIFCGSFLVSIYDLLVSVQLLAFDSAVLKDHKELWVRILVFGILVGVLAVLNLLGFRIQISFYYFCLSDHNEVINKKAMYDLLDKNPEICVPLLRTEVTNV